MKACLLENPTPIENRPLNLTDIEKPALQKGEVLLKISACGIGCTNLPVCEGEFAVKTSVQTFPLAHATDALIALKHDAIRGAGF